MESVVLENLLLQVEALAREAREAPAESRAELLRRIAESATVAAQFEAILVRAQSLLENDLPESVAVVSETPDAVAPEVAPTAEVEVEAEERFVLPIPKQDLPQSDVVETLEPAATPVLKRKPPVAPAAKKEFRKRLAELTKETDRLKGIEKPASLFEIRALVASARSVAELARETDCEGDGAISELELAKDLFAKYDDGEFFGMNPNRHHKSIVWAEVEQAYRRLTEAEEAISTFEAMRDELSEVPDELIQGLAACCSSLGHVNVERVLGVTDKDAHALILRLKKLWPKTFMGALKLNGSDALSIDRIESLAKKFPTSYREFVKARANTRKRAATSEALADLLELINEAADPEKFVDELLQAVETCVEAGTPPTKKELILPLLPYKAFFEHVQSKSMKAVKQELEKQLTLRLKTGIPPDVVEPEDIDVAHLNRLKELEPLLKNKVLLLVGGNKRQAWRNDELKKALKLKDVVWPDLEDASKHSGVFPVVDKADVVAQLIRWSRHHYSEVLDYAKSQGKPVVRILGGLGVKRIVHDLHLQLTRT